MGSIQQFLPGLGAGSSAINTGSQVVDGAGDLFAQVLGFLGGLVETATGSIAE